MNEVQWLKSLESPAPSGPPIDVSASVMAAVYAHRPSATSDRLYAVAAAAAILLGLAALAIAVPRWTSPDTPLAAFGEPVNLVLR